MTSVAIAHDYLTQRGGAERVVLAMARAFPEAPVHVSMYDPAGTFPEFADLDVRTTALDRVGLLRRHHRLALPVLAPVFSLHSVDADVLLCSSSGWAHGIGGSGRRVVYCHTPARWLYLLDDYVPRADTSRIGARAAMAVLTPFLRAWDQRAAARADAYLANSTEVAARIRTHYGRDAEILPPPLSLSPDGASSAVDGIEPGYVVCVARMLAYKHVDAVTRAFTQLPDQRLVVVGEGPLAAEIRAGAGPNVTFLGSVGDDALRWLYANSAGAVSASHEDFGLTTIEAAAFGKPSAVLGDGGFLDTVIDGVTGVFFDAPSADAVADGVKRLLGATWDTDELRRHAARFDIDRFGARLRAIVESVASSPAADRPGG